MSPEPRCDTGEAFAGVYGQLWLPTGYYLLEIAHHGKDSQLDRPFELVIRAEAIFPEKSRRSCEVNLFGVYKYGHLEFIDKDNADFLIHVLWNEDKKGVVIRALDFNNSSRDYDGDTGQFYCGQGMDFIGNYYDLSIR